MKKLFLMFMLLLPIASNADEPEITLHEYRHYLQSQEYGFGYLFSVGIPSILDLASEEGNESTIINGISYVFITR